MQSGITSISSR